MQFINVLKIMAICLIVMILLIPIKFILITFVLIIYILRNLEEAKILYQYIKPI